MSIEPSQSGGAPLKPRHTGRGIVLRDGKILLMERWRPGMHYFSIPGGGIEAGETPEETAIREIDEETTIKVATDRLVLIMRDGDIEHKIYLCTYIEGEPTLLPDSPEFIDMNEDNKFKPGWVAVSDLESLPFTYWKPIQKPLIEGIKSGFPDEPIVVTAIAK